METEIKWADGQAVIAESDIRWADVQPFVYYYSKKTLLEVNDRLKAKDSATGIMVDDLFKAAIKLTFRGRTFLVLK